jgi:hypothetical protein
MLPPPREHSFHVFRIVQICDPMVPKRAWKWTPWSACRSKNMEVERFRKLTKNVISKVPTFVINMRQKEGPKNRYLCSVQGPHPRMLSKASTDRLQGPKAIKMEALRFFFVVSLQLVHTFWKHIFKVFRVYCKMNVSCLCICTTNCWATCQHICLKINLFGVARQGSSCNDASLMFWLRHA